jgi:hypothetical protein
MIITIITMTIINTILITCITFVIIVIITIITIVIVIVIGIGIGIGIVIVIIIIIIIIIIIVIVFEGCWNRYKIPCKDSYCSPSKWSAIPLRFPLLEAEYL